MNGADNFSVYDTIKKMATVQSLTSKLFYYEASEPTFKY